MPARVSLYLEGIPTVYTRSCNGKPCTVCTYMLIWKVASISFSFFFSLILYQYYTQLAWMSVYICAYGKQVCAVYTYKYVHFLWRLLSFFPLSYTICLCWSVQIDARAAYDVFVRAYACSNGSDWGQDREAAKRRKRYQQPWSLLFAQRGWFVIEISFIGVEEWIILSVTF